MKPEIETAYLAFIYTDPVYLMDMPQDFVEEVAKDIEPNVLEKVVEVKEVVQKTIPTIPALPKQKAEEKASKSLVKCMLLFDSEDTELSKDELEFCTKIMKACGLNSNEFTCVNFRGLTIHDVKERYEFSKLVVFGTEIPKLVLGKYKCTLVNSTYILYSDPLWMVQNNKELKSFLWDQLQLMFGLKK